MRFLREDQDHEYPFTGVSHTRNIVRAIVYNDNFEIALNKVHCFDKFGERDIYETPGGGVDPHETLIEALRREIKEEVGAEIDNIQEIGRVVDYYNLIQRRNNNHFYLAHITSMGERHYTELEKSMNFSLVFVSIDEAIKLYENFRDLPVNNIVKQRELPILKTAKKKLTKIQKKS